MYPESPPNVMVVPTYQEDGFVVRWDSPYSIPRNTAVEVVGVHVYRSASSPDTGFERITSEPIKTLSYADVPEVRLVTETLAAQYVPSCGGLPVVTVLHVPVVSSQGSAAVPGDVSLSVDGESIPAYQVMPDIGRIVIDTRSVYDPVTQGLQKKPVVDVGTSVDVSYHTRRARLVAGIRQPVWWKVTSVSSTQEETPLSRAQAATYLNSDTVAWYWREAISRNSWLLYQGGERVKLFTRRWSGQRCVRGGQGDVETLLQDHSKVCPTCYGTGIVGGYDGPHDILIAPPDTEHNLERSERGIADKFAQSTWTGPSPIITQRDLVVKQDGSRYLVGPVTAITCPGAILQQEFSLEAIPASSPLMAIPIGGWPTVTAKAVLPDDQERGRTAVFVETTHGAEGAFPQDRLRRKR